MSDQPNLLGNEIESIRSAYAALNRGDIDRFVSDFAEDVERIEFEGSPSEGKFRGIEAVKAHVVEGRSTWAEGACEPERFTVVGDSIVVSVHVHVRLKDQTEWIDGHTADVFTFRDGKVIRFHTFFDERKALQFAGAA